MNSKDLKMSPKKIRESTIWGFSPYSNNMYFQVYMLIAFLEIFMCNKEILIFISGSYCIQTKNYKKDSNFSLKSWNLSWNRIMK